MFPSATAVADNALEQEVTLTRTESVSVGEVNGRMDGWNQFFSLIFAVLVSPPLPVGPVCSQLWRVRVTGFNGTLF